MHIYVHVPFCARRCSYCDFSIAVRKETPVDEYLIALERELHKSMKQDREGNFFDLGHGATSVSRQGQKNYPPDPAAQGSIYLGGGTPSRLGGEGVIRLINLLRTHVPIDEDTEVTLEANPDDITQESTKAWKSAGINRLSIGVQTFNDDILKWMHRTHSSSQIGQSIDAARASGIDNVSIDLIFALPQSLNRNWEHDLQKAIELSPHHISLYGLTVEVKTPLARWEERGQVVQAPEENYEREYLTAHKVLEAAGYQHYEVSNFGKPGFHSRHNSAYWTGAPYLGLGPSAHSFDGETRRWNVAPYTEWLERLSQNHTPVAEQETIIGDARDIERLYLGLRTTRGAAMSKEQMDQAARFVSAGWGTLHQDWLHLTPHGWLRLDSIVQSL